MTETSTFPNLETNRLILRKLADEDTRFIFHHFSDPQVTQFLMDEPPVEKIEEAKAIVDFYRNPESRRCNRWVIFRKADLRPVGTCGFHKWDQAHLRAEIGYDLAPDCWGQGFMTETLHTIIRHGFERMKLHRIDALVYVENFRSIAVLQKMGFKQEGILRDYFHLGDAFYDHLFFGLLHQDWQAKK